ncbi:MAG: hypothetical protein E7296_09785 [Lachnospiraceae bacterium]|jgi:hypothetical protein|nr:hypothetical protein [Lachnospiraceae bacterium]
MIMSAEQKKTIRNIAAFLVEKIMEKENCSRDEAVEVLIKTAVYEALMDPETDLYLESRESVLNILEEELAGNPSKLLEM